MSGSATRSSFRFVALLASAAALVFTGCGIGANVDAPVAGNPTGLSGIAHGGPNPINKATVTLYATTSGGYGATATVLGTATTDSNGSFTFNSPAACTSGQQAYVAVYGGNPGSGSNSNYLLLDALGDCSKIGASTNIWVDEVTTVAAAYTLAPFITINAASASAPVVNIGAPAANNTASPSCTGTGASMTCTADGLAHAFLNANMLVNSVSPTGTPTPNGQAYTVSPYNSDASIPTAVINSLANAVESCVNSTGGTGATTPCGKLFADTTPPQSGAASPINTLQALIDVAQNPTLTAANVTALYNLASPITYYQPTLAAAPPDYSLAVVYSGVVVGEANGTGGTSTSFGSVRSVALDAADNLYSASYASPNGLITGMASDGAATFAYTNATYSYPRILAADAIGNLYFSNETGSSASYLVEIGKTGTFNQAISIGTPYYPYGVAVDKFNNVYTVTNAATSPSVYEVLAGGTTASVVQAGGSTFTPSTYPIGVAVDSSGDVWDVNNAKGSTSSDTLISNTTTGTATPAFGSSTTTTEDSANGYGYSVTFDSNANAFVNNETDLYKVAVTAKSQSTTGGVTTVTPASVASAAELSLPISNGTVSAVQTEFNSIDGANNVFLPDYNKASSYLWEYMPTDGTNGTFVAIQPCAVPNGATTCNAGTAAGTYTALYNPTTTAVDSTGTVWLSDYTSDSVTQVFGVGTPAWPLLAYAHRGQEPQ